ncbi:Uncharacterised protein [Segatella copri]|nr:Uncharacterised protein [Segatella copri]
MVEGIVSDGTTSFVRIYLSEVVPESQTYFRQQDTTLAASLVERFCIAIAIGVSMINTFNVHHSLYFLLRRRARNSSLFTFPL